MTWAKDYAVQTKHNIHAEYTINQPTRKVDYAYRAIFQYRNLNFTRNALILLKQ